MNEYENYRILSRILTRQLNLKLIGLLLLFSFHEY